MPAAQVSKHPDLLPQVLLILALALTPLFYGANRDWAWGVALLLVSAASLNLALRGEWLTRLQAVQFAGSRAGFWLLLGWLSYTTWLPFVLVQFNAGMMGSDAMALVRTAGRSLLAVQVFLLCLAVFNRHRALKLGLQVLFGLALLNAVLACVLFLTGKHFTSSYFVFNALGASGTYVNKNHFAGYLELHLAIGAGLLLSGLRFHKHADSTIKQILRDLAAVLLSNKTQVRLGMIVMVTALVVTQSRGGNGAFFACLIGTGLLAIFIMRMRPPAMPWLLLSLVLVDMFLVGSWFGADRLAARIAATRYETQSSTPSTALATAPDGGAREKTGVGNASPGGVSSGAASASIPSGSAVDRERPMVARTAIRLWQQAPILGQGGQSFRLLFPEARPPEVSPSYYDHVHNDWAQWLMEYGVIGTFLAGMLLTLCWRAAIRALRTRSDKFALGLAFMALLGTSSLLAHGLVDFNLQIPGNANLFSFLLALAWISFYGVPETTRPETALPGRRARRAQVSAVALTLIFTASTVAAPLRCSIGQPDYTNGVLPVNQLRDSARQLLGMNAQSDERKRAMADLAKVIFQSALKFEALAQHAKALPYWQLVSKEFNGLRWRLAEASKQGDMQAQWLLAESNYATGTNAAWKAEDCELLIQNRDHLDEAAFHYRRALCLQLKAADQSVVEMQLAAKAGHPAALEAVGRLCAERGAAGLVCAVEQLCLAADAGRASAAGLAAFLLTETPPAPAVAVRAAALYEMAIAAGDMVSANNLGELYERGWIGKPDRAQAEFWYRKSAEKGLPEAALNLARLLLSDPNAYRKGEGLQWLRSVEDKRAADAVKIRKEFGIAEH
jgi:TPR repeat protein